MMAIVIIIASIIPIVFIFGIAVHYSYANKLFTGQMRIAIAAIKKTTNVRDLNNYEKQIDTLIEHRKWYLKLLYESVFTDAEDLVSEAKVLINAKRELLDLLAPMSQGALVNEIRFKR